MRSQIGCGCRYGYDRGCKAWFWAWFWVFGCGFQSWLRFWVIDSILGCGCGLGCGFEMQSRFLRSGQRLSNSMVGAIEYIKVNNKLCTYYMHIANIVLLKASTSKYLLRVFRSNTNQIMPTFPSSETPSTSNNNRFYIVCHSRRSLFTITKQHQLAAIMWLRHATIHKILQIFIALFIRSILKISSSYSSSELLC